MNVLPTPGRAAQLDLAAEQAGQLAADRQTEAGAAVLAAGAGVGLLEGLEDDALLLGRDADAGVGHLERDDASAPGSSTGWSGLQPPATGETVSRTPPCAVNLNAFDSRFFEDLLQALRVGDDAAAEPRSTCDVERQAAALRPRV